MKLLRTLEWAWLDWDLSCESEIDIHLLLPKAGMTYTVTWDPRSGGRLGQDMTHALWCPPHSELNGWHDRPSEILNSYVLHGAARTIADLPADRVGWAQSRTAIELRVSHRDRFVDLLTTAVPVADSSIQRVGLAGQGSSYITWEKAFRVHVAQVGPWIYLTGAADETELEAIVTVDDADVTLHYVSESNSSWDFGRITRYRMDADEAPFFLKLIDTATPLNKADPADLQPHRIRGAQSM